MITRNATADEHAAIIRRLRAEGREHLAAAVEAGAAYEENGVRLLPPRDAVVQRAAPIIYKPMIAPAKAAPPVKAPAPMPSSNATTEPPNAGEYAAVYIAARTAGLSHDRARAVALAEAENARAYEARKAARLAEEAARMKGGAGGQLAARAIAMMEERHGLSE